MVQLLSDAFFTHHAHVCETFIQLFDVKTIVTVYYMPNPLHIVHVRYC
jgi:hypothetical protein